MRRFGIFVDELRIGVIGGINWHMLCEEARQDQPNQTSRRRAVPPLKIINCLYQALKKRPTQRRDSKTQRRHALVSMPATRQVPGELSCSHDPYLLVH